MKMKGLKLLKLTTVLALCLGLSSCEEPRVYGSVGFSSFSGGYHGGIGTSVTAIRRARASSYASPSTGLN